MSGSKPRILVISSVDPFQGTGTVAWNFFRAFREAGIEADFLTKYPVKDHPEILHVFPEKKNRLLRWLDRRSIDMPLHLGQQGNHAFDYGRENRPPVPTCLITRQIRKQYDAVFVVFWYQLLSYSSIQAIHRKLQCQIHLRCPDNQPIGGGCHFIGGCPRLEEGCGFCPGLIKGSAKDFTAFNHAYRKRVLEHVKPIIYGNTHMQMIYRKSSLLRDYGRLETVYPLVDNAFFHPMDPQEARAQAGIPAGPAFVLFFGCTILDEERKGMRYLLEALRIFHDGLSEKERKEVLLVLAGNHADAIREWLPFDSVNLGYIPFQTLPAVYSSADAFLCPSIDDAGPSMVNQSLSCGTPVVAFNIGTALDMVQGQDSGYCARLRDTEDFARGIRLIYESSPEEKARRRAAARSIALERTTEEAFVNRFLDIYRKYL